MPLINWKDEYSVGVHRLDSDHKKLFGFVNKLHDAMKEGQAARTTEGIIKELLDYTKYHFGEEEKLMEEINYPGLNSHKRTHEKFISEVEKLKQEADNGMAIFVSVKLVNSAISWLKDHILLMDKKYQSEMNANGIR